MQASTANHRNGTARTIAVVTVDRSDYGCYLPVLKAIHNDPELRLRLIVGGSSASNGRRSSVDDIDRDGFAISDRVQMRLASDNPVGIATSMGLGVIGFAQAYDRCRPDILLVLGDRFEMHAAAAAALPFKIPVAHI